MLFAPGAMAPMVELPPTMPFTLHETDCDGLPLAVSVAVNTCAPETGTAADGGETAIEISSLSVTGTEFVAVGSATLAAVIVIAGEAGMICGAV